MGADHISFSIRHLPMSSGTYLELLAVQGKEEIKKAIWIF